MNPVITATIISVCCMLMISAVGIVIHVVQKKKQKKMTGRTVGHVIRYSYRGEGRLAPVVEYTVEGKTYEVRRKFRGYITKTVHAPVPIVRDSGAYVNSKDYLVIKMGNITNTKSIAEELWPVGKEMEVFYNPDKPEKAYAEKFPKLPSLETVVFFWTGIGCALLLALVGMLIYRQG